MRRFTLALLVLNAFSQSSIAARGTVKYEDAPQLAIDWKDDESIRIAVDKEKGPYNAPIGIRVGKKEVAFNGFYIRVDKIEDGFTVESVNCRLENDRIHADYLLSNPKLSNPIALGFQLWMEPEDRGLRVQVTFDGHGAHLDRLGIGDYTGEGLAAKRLFFGRMWVIDRPEAFEHEHNYNTCRFWCRRMDNGLSELQATGGPAKGFRYDPANRFDLYTYCESPIDYLLFFSERDPQDLISEYRETITVPAPPTLSQLPGRVGVMTAYPIAERYEDFLEEWTGRGARDFVWLSYYPTPGDRAKVEPFGALYATYDTYLDAFKEGPRLYQGWTPEMVQYRDTDKMVRGYWSSSWLLPNLYLDAAKTRVMGVFGHEFRNDKGDLDFVPSPATHYSNMTITKAEVNPSGMYLDVHASKAPHHFFDYQHNHHGAREHMAGEKALFDYARSYLGNVPLWSEGGGEDYVGLMDGGWFMDWRPPTEEGIKSAKWQYYPFIDEVHRERLLNMGIYYPVQGYDVNMVNAAILFGRPQAVSVYSGTPQNDVSGKLMAYYMTKAFHKMLSLNRMTRVDFQDDDIDRAIVHYANGAMVWSNRSRSNWDIGDYVLPPMGWFVKGPDDFLEYHALKDGQPVDVVRSYEYDFFAAEKRTDFGPVVTDGAIAILHNKPRASNNAVATHSPSTPTNIILSDPVLRSLGEGEREGSVLTLYEIRKPTGAITLKLAAFPGMQPKAHATRAYAFLTRNRKLELPFPDFRQPADPSNPTLPGPTVEIRPVEMTTALGYTIEFESQN